MADNQININVDSPNVSAPVSIDWSGGGTFVDSLRNWLDDFVNDVKNGADEALTVAFLGAMFFAAGLYLWRKV